MHVRVTYLEIRVSAEVVNMSSLGWALVQFYKKSYTHKDIQGEDDVMTKTDIDAAISQGTQRTTASTRS